MGLLSENRTINPNFFEANQEDIRKKLKHGLGLWENEAEYVIQNPRILQSVQGHKVKIGNILLEIPNKTNLSLGKHGILSGTTFIIEGESTNSK